MHSEWHLNHTGQPWQPLTVSDGGVWIWNGVTAYRLSEPPPPPAVWPRCGLVEVTPEPRPWYARLWDWLDDALDALMLR
jgi:hypothetical protein